MSPPGGHPLDQPWPRFLDLLDEDPHRAWLEFHEFAWKSLRAVPPPVFRDLAEETREDLIADIVFKCAENEFRVLRSYRNRGLPFAAWLATLARNRSVDWVRREGGRPEFPNDPPRTPDEVDRIEHRDLLEAVGRSLREIRAKCRLLLEAAADGLKPREIAVVLGLPPDAGKKISDDLRSCRQTLIRQLEKNGYRPLIPAGGRGTP